MKKAETYIGSNLDQARQKLSEKILSFERIRSMPGRENLTQEEYEETVKFVETVADALMSSYLSDPEVFLKSIDETNPK